MNKLRYLKKGFSLVEIAIILVVIGVLFIAASSIIQGRSSSLEATRTENRLQQIHDIIVGSAKYTGFLPADSDSEVWLREKPLERIGTLTRIFSNSGPKLDGYGNYFLYKHGKGENDFFQKEALASTPYSSRDLCSNSGTNMTIDFHSPSMTNVGNVAYIVYSYGKNGTEEISFTNGSGAFGTNYTINIPIADAKFDDKFQYMTLEQIQKELQCPVDTRSTLEIYTKALAIKPSGSGQKDTQPKNSAAPVVTRNIIYTNTFKAQWCIEVADSSLLNQVEATKQIEAFRLTSTDDYINVNETPPVPVRINGDCADNSKFSSSHNDSASLQIVLNSDATKLVPNEYYYNVHLLAQNNSGVWNKTKQLIKINVPNP